MREIIAAHVEFPGDGFDGMGYLAHPKEGTGPGVVVIQEWWGLEAHIKDVTERFAREGYTALAPDLYHGKATSEPDEARKLAMELDRARAVKEIVGAARYLKSLGAVAPAKVGVIGWCMGGGLAFAVTHATSEFNAAVGFYGRPPMEDETARINCPVLGLFGEADGGIPPAVAEEFRASLVRRGKTHEIHVYPGAPHAFFNDTRPHIYRANAAQDAWKRTLKWFETYLR
ncbi:MAG TPA: dienelactone hydrolase family protein [Anaerolineae bacterium]|nr:dienelactone hydrolase family protein [Anaerolineae bacterium]